MMRQGDVHREKRHPMGEIGRAIQRIDHPQPFGFRQRPAGTLFRKNDMRGKLRGERLVDQVIGSHIGRRHQIDRAALGVEGLPLGGRVVKLQQQRAGPARQINRKFAHDAVITPCCGTIDQGPKTKDEWNS